MKYIYIVFSLILSNFVFSQENTKAENANTEQSIIGIQTGLYGVWTYGEFKVVNNITFRTEFGLDFSMNFKGNSNLALAPMFKLEPRFYYNMNKRAKERKTTTNNSANFLAITADYHPKWFVISKEKRLFVHRSIVIAPKWGMKRSINKHFHYEVGFALGIRSYFGKKIGFGGESTELAADIDLRIGYDF